MQADAVCASDLDLDGDFDIVIGHSINSQTAWGGIYVMENDGYGHFEYLDSVFDIPGSFIVLTDTVLSKTFPDVVYHSYDSIVILTTDGTNYEQHRFLVGPKVNEFDLGDVDGNGHLDVVFSSNNYHYWGIIYNQGENSFSLPEYYELELAPADIVCEDLNNDGKEEIIVAGASLNGEIWYSTQNGLNKLNLPYGATNIRIADLDNDGDNDIITFSDAYAVIFVHVYENLGNNIFDTVNNFTIYEGCSDFFVTDFNNDSLPDALFLTHDFNQNSLLLWYNEGGFQFGHEKVIELEHYGEARRFMHCADMDGNGYEDILITRQVFDTAYAPSLLEILFNDGHGNFVDDPLTTIQTQNFRLQTPNLLCYPNPFTYQTRVEYTIEKKSFTSLDIYNLHGKHIKALHNSILTRGKYNHMWDGTDQYGKEVSSGVYIIRLVAGRHKQQCRLMYN